MVNVINCEMSEFSDRVSDKKMVCFGAGAAFDSFCERYAAYDDSRFLEKIEFIIDNNENLSGTFKNVNGKAIPIISLRLFLDVELKGDYVILITNVNYLDEILNQLDNEAALNNVECYSSFLLGNYRNKSVKIEFTKGNYPKIPKKIHYCWFGGATIPEHLQKFMGSWSKICPDYEIVRWDESNYDVIKNPYMEQAYEAKKWGFVPDYARLDIIYNHGGIYLDTDVEILKPFDDLLYDDMFCGFESNSIVNLGQGFGAVAGHSLIKAMLDQYEGLRFINQDGSLNLTPSPAYQSMVLRQYGFKLNDKYQTINGIAVYPTEVLCPKTFYGIEDNFTINTHSVHHFDASWIDEEKKKIQSKMGKKAMEIIDKRKSAILKKI